MSGKKILKAIVFTMFAIAMLRACTLEYYCNIVDTIPQEIRERIVEKKPEYSIQELAEYWIEHRDSFMLKNK